MSSKTQPEKASFEKAYAFYRGKKDVAALGVIRKLDSTEPRVMELKAQILYRMENFGEALELFKKLIRTHSDEFDDLRRANLLAIKARLQAKGEAQELDQMNLDTFELMYNNSCHLIACEKFDEALKLLNKAEVEGNRVLTEDGLSKEEIQLEMAPIRAQKAFVLQKLGSNKEALSLYLDTLKTKNLDAKMKSAIEENLSASFIRFGKKWRPLKRKQEEMELDGADIIVTTAAKKSRKVRPKKNKTRLSANYDPEVPPDPERWLPRQERQAYRKKLHKKFKDRDVGRGTQGAAAGSSANIDYSNKATTPGVVGASPQASPKPTEGPRQQRPTQQAKKNKKKKGGKW